MVVNRRHAKLLKREVDIAARSNRFWPPSSLDLPTQVVSKAPTIVAIAALCVLYFFQSRFELMKESGMLSVEAIEAKSEWWRSVTAITLHADIGHLSGNILGISIFGYLSCRYLGNGLAWLTIITGAILANFSSALLHWGEPFNSLGASTAVFAALGLLAAYPLGGFLRRRDPIESRDWFIPFLGGCILLAWMGGGEPPVDVGGHLLSFGFGFALTLPIAFFQVQSKLGKRLQISLLFATILLFSACWAVALKT